MTINITNQPGGVIQNIDKPVVNMFGRVDGKDYNVVQQIVKEDDNAKCNFYDGVDMADNPDVLASTEELFRFIHPTVSENTEIQVHQQIKKLVKRFGMQDICKFLYNMAEDRKILLPQNIKVAYAELIRMGMPNEEGYAYKTFEKYYKR